MLRVIQVDYGLDNDAVLASMKKVPREDFVPEKFRRMAYRDGALPIGHGQTISQPYTVALMTSLAAGVKKKRVLEVGTGSGYQAAVLSNIFDEVYTIEIIGKLAKEAKKRLKRLGYHNVYVRKGKGGQGWKETAPFDAILVTAGLDKKVPQVLFDQLKVGGRLVAPIGERENKKMWCYTKLKSGRLRKEQFGTFLFVPYVK